MFNEHCQRVRKFLVNLSVSVYVCVRCVRVGVLFFFFFFFFLPTNESRSCADCAFADLAQRTWNVRI